MKRNWAIGICFVNGTLLGNKRYSYNEARRRAKRMGKAGITTSLVRLEDTEGDGR